MKLNWKFIIVWILTWIISGYLSTYITPIIVGYAGPLGSIVTIVLPPLIMLLIWYKFTQKYAGSSPT